MLNLMVRRETARLLKVKERLLGNTYEGILNIRQAGRPRAQHVWMLRGGVGEERGNFCLNG
jgi:hypothetical protein